MIKITPKMLDSLIWKSYRYSIGRHTIDAYYHAKDLYDLIKDNKDELGKEQIEFMVKDIRETIKFKVRCDYRGHVDSDTEVWYELVDKLEKLVNEM